MEIIEMTAGDWDDPLLDGLVLPLQSDEPTSDGFVVIGYKEITLLNVSFTGQWFLLKENSRWLQFERVDDETVNISSPTEVIELRVHVRNC